VWHSRKQMNDHGDSVIFVPIINHDLTNKIVDKPSDVKVLRDFLSSLSELLRKSNRLRNNSTKYRNLNLPLNPLRITALVCINKAYSRLEARIQIFREILEPLRETRFWSSDERMTQSVAFNWFASTWSPHHMEFTKKFNVPFIYVPFAVDAERFNCTPMLIPWEQRPCDVFLRWDTNPKKYCHRQEINQLLVNSTESARENTGLLDGITVESPKKYVKENNYKEIIASCRMTITTIGMPGRYDLLGTRYYEIQASGTTLLFVERADSPEAQRSYKTLGFVDGETVVSFSNVSELLQLIRYYKSNGNEAMRMVKKAQQVAAGTSWASRGSLFIEGILNHT